MSRLSSDLDAAHWPAMLGEVLHAGRSVVWDWDVASGRVRRIGPVREVLGLEPDAPAADFLARVHPDDRPRVERAIRAALDQGQPYDEDFRIVRPDGQLRWVEARGRGSRPDAEGRCTRLTGVLLDITGRKQVEDDLALSRRRLAHQLAAARRLHELSMWDGRGPLEAWLQQVLDGALDAVGLTHGALHLLDPESGQPLLSASRGLDGPGLAAAADCALRDAARARERVDESLFEGPALEAAPAGGVAAPATACPRLVAPLRTPGGEPIGVLTLFSDVPAGPDEELRRELAVLARIATERIERRRAEAQLRASEARFRTLAEASPALIWQIAADGRQVYLNPRYRELVGLTDELLAAWHTMLHPADAPAFLHALERAQYRRTALHHELRVRTPQRGWRWLECFAMPWFGDDGDYQGHVGISLDVTARRRAEDELRQTRHALEVRVRARTAELAQANAALQIEVGERRLAERQVRALLGQLVSAEEEERRRLSRELHDTVGQHLAALELGLASLERHPACAAALFGPIRQLQRAAHALDDAIDRVSHELRPPALDDLGLADALRRYAATWSQECGVAVDLHLYGLQATPLPPALETTVYRVVQEALTNVRKHAGARRVGLFAERRGARLRVIVEDDGRGFDPAQAAATHPGRRFGLRSMTERALLVDGRLEIESNPGQGTTLYLTVPLDEGPVRAEASASSHA
jgi:PAS domain S-box-containing protein